MYNFVSIKIFYESQETYINTEGLIKRTNKLITNKKTREGRRLTRNLLKNLNNKYLSVTIKNNNFLFFNSIYGNNFKNFISFHCYPINKLNNCISFLTT